MNRTADTNPELAYICIYIRQSAYLPAESRRQQLTQKQADFYKQLTFLTTEFKKTARLNKQADFYKQLTFINS